jgi:glucosamine--fructose-6-phosphate aminotransferase (isomerizing)
MVDLHVDLSAAVSGCWGRSFASTRSCRDMHMFILCPCRVCLLTVPLTLRFLYLYLSIYISTYLPTYLSTYRDFLIEGLTVLKNRGYDSAGLATMPEDGGHMVVTKYASDGDKADGIELVAKHSAASAGHSIGIAHTRWATHGGKTDENAHPHCDSSGKIALVHNGTLNNANELRRELQAAGHVFTSQTDTEVIAKLIGHVRDADPSISVRDATEKALIRCDGSWGLCIMCTDTPDELIVACNGSPLVIGIADDRTFVASETSAFNRYTKNFISMRDGEIGVLHADGRALDLTRTQVAPDQEVKLSPEPYPHWTLKEYVLQIDVLCFRLCVVFGLKKR